MNDKPLKILMLSSTRKERDGIAEYTRQLFRPEFQGPAEIEVKIEDITFRNMLFAPFQKADVLHIQHEFFMFDRLAGVSALVYYPYLWFCSNFLGFKLITTIHSTFNLDDLEGALPHFRKLQILFPLGRFYLRIHLCLVTRLSKRIIILTKVGLNNLKQAVSCSKSEWKLCYIPHGNFPPRVNSRRNGLLEDRFDISSTHKIFTLFGFAFPNKGYELAIYAMEILVNQRHQTDVKLVIVSGETATPVSPEEVREKIIFLF